MINDASFSNKAKEIFQIYDDNLVHPMCKKCNVLDWMCLSTQRSEAFKITRDEYVVVFIDLLIDDFLAPVVSHYLGESFI